MRPEMARDRAGIDVIATADRGRDDEAKLLATVEVADVVGTGTGIEEQREGERGGAEHRESP